MKTWLIGAGLAACAVAARQPAASRAQVRARSTRASCPTGARNVARRLSADDLEAESLALGAVPSGVPRPQRGAVAPGLERLVLDLARPGARVGAVIAGLRQRSGGVVARAAFAAPVPIPW